MTEKEQKDLVYRKEMAVVEVNRITSSLVDIKLYEKTEGKKFDYDEFVKLVADKHNVNDASVKNIASIDVQQILRLIKNENSIQAKG